MKKTLPSYRITADPPTREAIKAFYAPWKAESPTPHIEFFAKGEGFAASVYKPDENGQSTVLFQGLAAASEAGRWAKGASSLPAKPEPRKRPFPAGPAINRYPQIGSDEVGTGDLFGPISVCAAYVERKQLPILAELKVTDSKEMEDAHILAIGPQLLRTFDYAQLSLPNDRYNDIHGEMNMNAIKAKLHNRAILNLLARHPKAHVYQDQFAEPDLYYSYLKDEKEVARGIVFRPKGESLFPSVALASVIARYSFLRKMEELSEKFGMRFPFGAGEEADVFAKEFVARYGREGLKEVAKLNFANLKKII
jgi:ribonuclease HIII